MDLNWVRKLYAHMEWSDALLWRRVLAHDICSADPYIRESLVHLHLVQQAYLGGWTDGSFEMKTIDDFPSLEAVRDWGRPFYSEVATFLGTADLDSVGEVLWKELIEKAIGQVPVPASLGDMVFQVASHGIHHRAQINRRIREVGGEPGFIDYVAWVWLGSPAADWT